MNNETEIIGKLEKLLETADFQDSFEIVSLALSIKDEEDRDWQLFEIAKWLLSNNDWQKSHGIAQLISEGYEKSEALRLIADKMAEIGHLERALFVFAEAEHTSESENLADWQKAELLHKLAKSLRKHNAVFKAEKIREKAVQFARKGEVSGDVQESLDCSSVLAEIAESIASAGEFKKAFDIAQNIKSIGKKERAIKKISELSEQIKKVA
jgi:tetratricopeptide (TPR) repeat protein